MQIEQYGERLSLNAHKADSTLKLVIMASQWLRVPQRSVEISSSFLWRDSCLQSHTKSCHADESAGLQHAADTEKNRK